MRTQKHCADVGIDMGKVVPAILALSKASGLCSSVWVCMDNIAVTEKVRGKETCFNSVSTTVLSL